MVFQIGHIHGVAEAYVCQVELFQRKMAENVHVRDQGDAEILRHKRGDSVLVRRFTDDIGRKGVGGVCAVREPPEPGRPVISHDRIVFKVFQPGILLFCQGMAERRDNDHLLLQDGNELDARFVFHVGAEDHVVFFGFQAASRRYMSGES